MLTDVALKCLKPRDKPYKVTDRDGMYVHVSTSGTLTFRLDYRLHGRRETLSLGKYGPSGLSLARAREATIDAKRAVSKVDLQLKTSSATSGASRKRRASASLVSGG